ncbi:MAG: NUDIX domain-containing protein [Bacteroidetes bacterium]|nr:NUDIX domain-containing protein [Bacteroidota bacterium]
MDSSLSKGQRYRVFLNEKSILISEDINIVDNQVNNRFVTYQDKESMQLEYERFSKEEDCSQLIILAGNLFCRACEEFRSIFIEIKAAGGVVKNREGKILFIKRWDVWDLPKGKLEINELPEAGALREVEEETALSSLSIIRQLPSTFHIYNDRHGKAILKETCWYEMSYNGDQVPVPQTEEDITEAKWFEPRQIDIVLNNTYVSLQEMISGFASDI